MITFKEILNKVVFEEVWDELIEYYPNMNRKNSTKRKYLTVFESLLSKDPAKNVEEMIIHIDEVNSDASLHEDDVEYRVHGKNNSSEWDGYWDISADHWEEWLGFYIDHKVLERFSSEQIAALCLYEMTWFGFSEELNHE